MYKHIITESDYYYRMLKQLFPDLNSFYYEYEVGDYYNKDLTTFYDGDTGKPIYHTSTGSYG